MIEMNEYFDKIKNFNKRDDYLKDIDTARLILKYCLENKENKKIYFIGTGLGGDSKIIEDLKGYKIIGIEPRKEFQKEAIKRYQKFGGKLIEGDLENLVKKSDKLSGIFLFIHSINHISKNQLKLFQKSIKNSYIIIINPNPEIESIVGKTDKTVIKYLNSEQINKLLNTKIIFDFFYNSVTIKRKKILLRQVILLKTN